MLLNTMVKHWLREKIRKKENEAVIGHQTDSYRLWFHLMPPVGWLDDPNGLCQFHGEYQVFFQYSPLDAQGGMKAWGHYSSQDWIHWNFCGVPFLPDQSFDKDGVYSGSAIIQDGCMYLYYTGNVNHSGGFKDTYEESEANTVLVTSEDGIHFSDKKCIMENRDYPSNYTCHVRDPKVWRQGNCYYMVQGGKQKGKADGQGKGAVLLFDSCDLVNWKFRKDITTPERFGSMWDCPDYFELSQGPAFQGNIGILSVSPQGLETEKFHYQSHYQSGYFKVDGSLIGDGELQEFTEWDMGFDFYAPQTFEDEQERRILIGWAGIPAADYDNQPTADRGWQHALTLPRVLTWRNGKVFQNPVDELKSLRGKDYKLTDAEGVSVTFPAAWELEVTEIDSADFLLKVNQMDSGFQLHYSEGVFSMEFYGVRGGDIGRGRNVRKFLVSGLQKVRVLMDTSLVEVYLNEGEYVLTSRYYLNPGEYSCQAYCEGSKKTAWELDRFPEIMRRCFFETV